MCQLADLLNAFFIDSPRLSVETVRTMLATVLAAIPSLQQILFGKDNVALFGIVKVLRVKFRSSEIIVHLAHVCKVNKNRGEGFWERCIGHRGTDDPQPLPRVTLVTALISPVG